jgi:hypothetical protein
MVIALSGHSFGVGFTGAGTTVRRASATICRSHRAERRREVAAQYAAVPNAADAKDSLPRNLRRFGAGAGLSTSAFVLIKQSKDTHAMPVFQDALETLLYVFWP